MFKASHLSWSFKGEGNANLVFAYTGHTSILEGLVLRVRKGKLETKKTKIKKQETLQSLYPVAFEHLTRQLWTNILLSEEEAGRDYEYIAHYMRELVGPEYVHAGVRVRVPSAVMRVMETQGMAPPPPHLPALLQPDHSAFAHASVPQGFVAGGPVVCVEIKPKSGCMPTSTHLDPTTAHLKQRYPRFLMHSVLKHTQGQGVLSTYNPPDLFSRDPVRVQRAIRALLAAPNNNLRVFVGGVLVLGGRPAQKTGDAMVYANKGGSLSTLAAALQPAVCVSNRWQGGETAAAGAVDPAEQDPRKAGAAQAGVTLAVACEAGAEQAGHRCMSTVRRIAEEAVECGHMGEGAASVDKLVELVADILCREELLSRLLKVQEMDQLDPEGAIQLLRALLSHYSQPGRKPAGHAGGGVGNGEEGRQQGGGEAQGSTPIWEDYTEESALAGLRDYLTAASAKDCSVMVTLQALSPARPEDASQCQQQPTTPTADSRGQGGSWPHVMDAAEAAEARRELRPAPKLLVSPTHGQFMYKVAALDLDIKQLSKIAAHAELDAAVLATAAANINICEQLLAGQLPLESPVAVAQ